jgi:DNA polymerase III sliding clamp (beta) subunit (PCNA family)
MKIYDITKFALQSSYKPELNAVYVKYTDTGIVYVTTDSFRLVEVRLDDESIKELLREGFYTLEQWKLLSKATSKKEIEFSIINMIGKSEDLLKESQYPDYTQILPEEFVDFTLNLKQVDPNYFYEHIKFLEKVT